MYFKILLVFYTIHIMYLVVAVDETYDDQMMIRVSLLDGNTTSYDSSEDDSTSHDSPKEIPFEYKSTKVVNIQTRGISKELQLDLRKIIAADIKGNVEGAATKLIDDPTEPVRVEGCSQTDNNSREVNDNSKLNNTTQEILTTLKSIVLEIAQLKKDVLTSTNSLKRVYTQGDQHLEIRSYPIGLNQNRFCHQISPSQVVTEANKIYPKSCKEIRDNGNNASGIYRIQPRKSQNSFMVLCDMETKGGGWAHVQKRYDGSQDFFLEWRDYKFGFGDLEGEFWIGLENLYLMTGFEESELLIELVDRDDVKYYAHYKVFKIGPGVTGYQIKDIDGFNGDIGDSMSYHKGSKFYTKDFDREGYDGNCAETRNGAWWYNSCYMSNLNGKYLNIELPEKKAKGGVQWRTRTSHVTYSYAKTRMMVRPAEA